MRNDAAKRCAFVHGDIGQHLPVEFDPGQLQAVHERAIGHPFGADSGVDALNPQGTEAALLHLAIAIGVLSGLFDGLTGDADRVLTTAIIALRRFENPLVLCAGGYTPFYACQFLNLLAQPRP